LAYVLRGGRGAIDAPELRVDPLEGGFRSQVENLTTKSFTEFHIQKWVAVEKFEAQTSPALA
jgi:hypothetical protein